VLPQAEVIAVSLVVARTESKADQTRARWQFRLVARLNTPISGRTKHLQFFVDPGRPIRHREFVCERMRPGKVLRGDPVRSHLALELAKRQQDLRLERTQATSTGDRQRVKKVAAGRVANAGLQFDQATDPKGVSLVTGFVAVDAVTGAVAWKYESRLPMVAVAKAKPYLRWITASRGANVRMITIEEVCYFQADTKYTLVALPDGDSLIHIPIRDLLEQLDPQMFWQVHRSTIVNVQEIDTIGRDATDHVIVRMKRRTETIRVSQQFAYRFRQM
jgi:DNA-binding LytR/AlgR family response regulator